jgi:ribosomal protein L5
VQNHGIQITVKTTSKSPEAGRALLKEMGFPFSA